MILQSHFQAVMQVVEEITPQTCLNAILESRGYSVKAFPSLDNAYYNERPTSSQLASYGGYLLYVLRNGDTQTLRSLLDAGLDPNACNQDGEYLVHHTCRWGQVDCLRTLLDFGSELQVADMFGRTPLHSLCSAENPRFDLVELILHAGIHLLFMADARGNLPLSYVPKDKHKYWIQFILSKKEQFWPQRRNGRVANKEGQQQQQQPDDEPTLALHEPNTRRPMASPKNRLPDKIAILLANGKMKADEVKLFNYLCVDDQGDDTGHDGSLAFLDFSNNNASVTFREEDLATILVELGAK